MKRYIIFLVPISLLLIASCKKQENPSTETLYDTLNVNVPYIEYALIENTILTLDATNSDATNYFWSPSGDTTPTITVTSEGDYTVQVSTHAGNHNYQVIVFKNGSDCYVPNSFSPNGDNRNDLWAPIFSEVSSENYYLRIYDQDNTKLFSTTDINGKWDGKFNGQDMPISYYYYAFSYYSTSGEAKNRNGMLQLFR
ncbi:MAG: T9SS type B sorting domain-containing protein [Bacteroidota bacterium]